MADQVPQALKQADIILYKTATRAAQLQSVKPIVAYWCEYFVVNQILAKNLHSTDADILNYTTTLMDRLEEVKNVYANEDAISDDTAAQAYIEQFAQETLDRAERVIKANKVTQQTASTFDAALTFFNLVNIWGPPDTETQQKIKYAKWNAARITKAIKEGKDPNESNPKKEDLPPQQPDLDPTDPEVQAFGGSSGQIPRSATVEDAPDADLPHSPAAPSLPSAPDDGELKLPSAPGYGDQPASDPQPGYFDPPPSLPSPISPPTHDPVNYTPSAPTAPQTWTPTPPPAASSFQPPPAAPSGPPTFAPGFSPTAAVVPPPTSPPTNLNLTNIPPPSANVSRPVAPPPTNTGTSGTGPVAPGGFSQVPQQVVVNFTADEQAMSQAQKHAKWAISALNFEDVPTAVRELHRALEALGAS
ncbi:Vacuolar protein sorting-associated protein vts1 [Cytospora mali]|uniref:Vacuolar protein sorting-associated protein vts1 n=1 Tax=Cytospora mali TaxID=578113 RepID=A0A194W2A7_CYTMA|nr:Vacuolar protein sorting-associated protein vts1 [Valsa mali]